MARHLHHHVVFNVTKVVVIASNYVNLSHDEIKTLNNQSWANVHAYVVQDWKMMYPYIGSLECVFNNASANNMIQLIIMGAFTKTNMTRKIDSFGINGVIFQGIHNGATMQIQIKYAPHVVGVHCIAHYIHLAMQTLNHLSQIQRLKVYYNNCMQLCS
jgi:hypothetical protein